MVYGLTIGTERAANLQQAIQDELTKRGYSPDADPVMAEYITIMVINNKTAAQITSELEDLIGADYDHSFTDWLFVEAAKGASGSDDSSPAIPSSSERVTEPEAPREIPVQTVDSRRPPHAPRNGVYQHALSQALPSSSAGQKRTASARSPSPSHPTKSRRTDLPTGPRAMLRDGNSNQHSNPRSLLDRVGGPAGKGYVHDDIQARIDNIVNSSPDQNMMMNGGFPGMNAMDMNQMAAGMTNPLLLQEMMMNQMALMAQMASTMGIPPQFGGPGYPMQGVMPGDMGMFPGGVPNNGFQQGPQNMMNGGNSGRGRGGARGGRPAGRGRGGASTPSAKITELPTNEIAPPQTTPTVNASPTIVAPTPTPASVPTTSTPPQRTGFVPPERPQSPTLCKFSLKCTNAHCRFSHPSPVATAESGVVLSNEACENGKDCKDKDCIKAHVSPAVLNPQAEHAVPAPMPPVQPHSHSAVIPCRFGAACTRPGCTFGHPPRTNHFAQQCRFGASCTRAGCLFQHPEGRVLPSTFHRGLSTTSPMVNVQTPETGTMGGPSPHRSVTFNNPSTSAVVKEKLEKQMKEIEEKKTQAEKAVKDAEAAANKKDGTKPVAIAA